MNLGYPYGEFSWVAVEGWASVFNLGYLSFRSEMANTTPSRTPPTQDKGQTNSGYELGSKLLI